MLMRKYWQLWYDVESQLGIVERCVLIVDRNSTEIIL
jgi:hypothetical protein